MSTTEELIAYHREWVRLHSTNPYQREGTRRMTEVLDALESARRDAPTFAEWHRTVTVLDDLPDAVRRERLATGKSIRGAAREIGISFSTLDRFERRRVGVQLAPVRAILVWLSGVETDTGEAGQ